MSEIVREFVGLPSPLIGRAGAGGHPCQGIYHRLEGSQPRTAFIATHYNVDFSEHYLASFMAERGYGFLGWNTRFRGNEAHFLLDHALAEIGVGVRWLREQAGAERVVLLGNSGGGSLMAAYQSQAVEPNVTPTADMHPIAALEDLPACDLFIALAAHSGRPEVLTNWLDASVTDDAIVQLLGTARRVYPALERAPELRRWAGLRPGTPDGRPIIGRDPRIEGLWYATGHGRNGILLAAVTAELVGPVLSGDAVESDLTAVSPARFWSE